MVTLRKVFAAGILLLIGNSLWAQVSHALPAIAYGPEVFRRHSRERLTTTASFPLPQLIYGPFSLHIEAPEHGVVVQLNGVTVFGDGVVSHPFAPETVVLQADNTLDITWGEREEGPVKITILGYRYEYTEAYQELPVATITPGPDDIDWRTKGVVTPVKDEGPCQADWAFSATGAVEGVNTLQTGTLTSLSEQELIDCIPRRPHDCAHGNPVEALKYILQNGDQTEAQYPYTAMVGTCQAGSNKPVSPAFTTITRLPPDNESSLVGAVNRHPVSIVLNTNWYSGYTGGVANPNCSASPPTFGAALVIGYTASYWIVKTPLGTGWGQRGVFYFARGRHTCAFNDFAVDLGD